MSLKIFETPGDTPVQFVDRFPGNIELYIKREDLIHPLVSGNKWRKLKYNLMEAHSLGYNKLVTFGGAFSNHILATAAAGAACGFKTVGIIRGEIVRPLNPTLEQAANLGMTLVAVTREEYRRKSDPKFQEKLKQQIGNAYLIPEGGTNVLAVKGCAEITAGTEKYHYWCVSCGTGGTLAGLLAGLGSGETVLGFPALKDGKFLQDDIEQLIKEVGINNPVSWKLITDYHFGGYARISNELVDFMVDFKDRYQILLDPIYTGKMIFGLVDLIKQGFFPENCRILAIHTGGLQGISGIEKKYGINLK